MIEAQLIRVQWLDSGMVISNGWMTVEETKAQATSSADVMHAETVGYLIHEDNDILILAQTIDLGADALLNAQVIAKDAVFDRTPLS